MRVHDSHVQLLCYLDREAALRYSTKPTVVFSSLLFTDPPQANHLSPSTSTFKLTLSRSNLYSLSPHLTTSSPRPLQFQAGCWRIRIGGRPLTPNKVCGRPFVLLTQLEASITVEPNVGLVSFHLANVSKQI